MPSNQCTTSLMELGFAVGNMAGAAVCDAADYKQLGDILAAWDCRQTGGAGDEYDKFVKLVGDAQRECEDGACLPKRCVDVWMTYNSLIKEVHDVPHQGSITRGPIPPKVKGPEGIARTRRGPVGTYTEKKPDPPAGGGSQNGEGAESLSATGTNGNRYARYMDDERRRRWYPTRV